MSNTALKTKANNTHERLFEVYRLVIDKCYRMSLLKDQIQLSDLMSDMNQSSEELITELDNNLVQALLPRIERTLNKSLFDMYQILYTIDVDETMIKEKIMDIKNTSLIPSIIAFAIIDRLKTLYHHHLTISA
ncbi:MAG: hypothetical protein Q8O95_05680 [bacterium]|nr:hypothetical protein [bacterium]